MNIEYGIYRHFRGKLYQVFGTATHSETGEKLVVYEPIDGCRGLWARPVMLFLDKVTTDDGRTVARFVKEPTRNLDATWPDNSSSDFINREIDFFDDDTDDWKY